MDVLEREEKRSGHKICTKLNKKNGVCVVCSVASLEGDYCPYERAAGRSESRGIDFF